MSTVSMQFRKLSKIIRNAIKPRIKVAIIGQGRHAITNLYPSLAYAGIELVATCARHNADYTDYKELFGLQIDAIIACVNAEFHYEIAKEAVKAKMPLFVEKPPAPSARSAQELCEANIMVGFNKRFSPVFVEAKRIIPKPLSMTVSVHVGKCPDKRTLLNEVGIHYIDLFRYFGVDGTLNITDKLSWDKAVEHIEILDEGNLVVIDNGVLTHHKEGKTVVIAPNHLVPSRENHTIYLNGYVAELENFAWCVKNKKPFSPNMNDGYEALRRVEEMV